MNIFLNKEGEKAGTRWRGLLTGILIFVLAVIAIGYPTGLLIDGQNKYETATLIRISEVPDRVKDVVNTAYYLPAYGLGQAIDDNLTSARIVSAVYGILAAILLYALLKRWFSARTAIIGGALFITSAWVLAISHQAAPFVLLIFTPLLIFWALTRYLHEKKASFWALLVLAMSLAFAVYVPYMFWPTMAVLFVVSLNKDSRKVKVNTNGILISVLAFGILIAPLIASLYFNPEQLRELMGIPTQLPSISEYATRFIKQFTALFMFTDPLPEIFLFQKPLLNIFSVSMLVLGIYHFARNMPKRRSISIAVAIGIMLVLMPLQNNYLIVMAAILPFIYILIPSGIHEIIHQWMEYFPRNPFARNAAVIVMVAVVGLSTVYNLQKFYVAWPNAPETKSSYVVQSKE